MYCHLSAIYILLLLLLGTTVVNHLQAQCTPTFIKMYGNPCPEDELLNLAIPTIDGGYIGVGMDGYVGARDLQITKLSACGDVEWTKTYANASINGGYRIRQTADGGYIILAG